MYKPENRVGEFVAAKRLIKMLLDRGYALSVYDGEEWVVRSTRDADEVIQYIGETEIDTLRVRDWLTGIKLGDFYLIWGNDPKGTELVADHTSNAVMDLLWEEWSEAQEKWAAA